MKYSQYAGLWWNTFKPIKSANHISLAKINSANFVQNLLFFRYLPYRQPSLCAPMIFHARLSRSYSSCS